MLLDLAVEPIDSVVAMLLANQPAAIFVQAQEPADAALQRALKKIGAQKIGAKFVMSPKQQYTLGENGWPIGRSAFSRETVAAIENVTENGDLVVTPRFTEFGGDRPQIGVGIHSFYLTTGKAGALCTATPSAAQQVKPVCMTTTPAVARALVSLHAMDFDFNAAPAEQNKRIALANPPLVFAPENNQPLLDLLRQPQLVVSTSTDLDPTVIAALLPNAKSLTLVLSAKVSQTTSGLAQLVKAGASISRRSNDHGGTIVIGLQQSYFGSHRLQRLHLEKSRDVGLIVPTAQFPNLRKLAM